MIIINRYVYKVFFCLVSLMTLFSSLLYANPIFEENRLAGTADWQLSNPALNREVEGYASHTSINKGEAVEFFINTQSASVQIDVFRMGWYRGLGGRQILSSVTVNGIEQIVPSPNSDGMVNCNWIPSYRLQTANNWVSGVYLAKLTESNNGTQSYIIFVIRDDNHSADIVFQLPVTTYQAYNFWGGKSSYEWGSGSSLPWGTSRGQSATRVSFNRPYAASSNPAAAFGAGAGEFLTNIQPVAQGYPISSAGWDYNYLRWLEREGYNVTYITNLDTHSRPEILFRAKAFLSIGHDEYWSFDMRRNVENALSQGVNLGFFGANSVYWQVRFSDDPITGGRNRIMDIYKSGVTDPYARDSNPNNDHLVTVRFRDLGRSEDALLGVRYYNDPVDGDIVISNSSHLLLNNTGLANGDRLAGLLGYEVDERAGNEPQNTETLATSPAGGRNAHMVTYVAPSGARVFSLGSIQWSWGLDDFGAPQLRSSRISAAAQQLTRNVLASFRTTRVQSTEANDDYYSADVNIPLVVSPPGVLANDNAFARTPRLMSGPNYGQLTFGGDGSFIYSPNSNFRGLDQFIYEVSSDTSSDLAQVNIYVNPLRAMHHWSMDENNPDTLINNVTPLANGSIFGATRVIGQRAGGLSFDGIDDFVSLNAPSLPGPWTASLWVRPFSATIDSVIFASNLFALKLQQWPYTSNVGFTRFGVADYLFSYIAPLDVWTHLTFVNNGSETRLYANCSLVGTNPNTIELPLTVFGRNVNGGSNLHADTDEIKIFDKALSDAEIPVLCDTSEIPGYDSDGDGVPDTEDAFPNDASETIDSDGDGVGNNADAFPNDAAETVDTDGDGMGDNTDPYPNDPSNGSNMLRAIHYWSMDENDPNVLVNSLTPLANGSIVGAMRIAGQRSGGLRFDGIDDSVTINAASVNGPWTASVWIKPNSSTLDSVILASSTFALKLQQWPYLGNVGFTRFGVADYLFSYTAPVGVWTHLTFVNNGSEMRLYANCTLVSTNPNPIDLPLTALGRNVNGGSHLNADADELKIFNRALVESEISTLCASSPAIHHWSMDETNPSILINNITSTANGSIVGAARITGQRSGGLRFDGIDDSVTINAASIPGPWTASMWIKPNAATIDSVILASNTFALKLQQWPYLGNVGFTRFGVADYFFNYTAPLGIWTHLTFVNTGNEMRLYANCILVNTNPNTVDIPVTLLGRNVNGGSHLNADIDELKIFNRALTVSEISASCSLLN